MAVRSEDSPPTADATFPIFVAGPLQSRIVTMAYIAISSFFFLSEFSETPNFNVVSGFCWTVKNFNNFHI
jgi:hypothetical protein